MHIKSTVAFSVPKTEAITVLVMGCFFLTIPLSSPESIPSQLLKVEISLFEFLRSL